MDLLLLEGCLLLEGKPSSLGGRAFVSGGALHDATIALVDLREAAKNARMIAVAFGRPVPEGELMPCVVVAHRKVDETWQWVPHTGEGVVVQKDDGTLVYRCPCDENPKSERRADGS